MQINVRGVLNKQGQLNDLLNKYCSNFEIHIVVLVETWLTKSNKHMLEIPNYTYRGKKRLNKKEEL